MRPHLPRALRARRLGSLRVASTPEGWLRAACAGLFLAGAVCSVALTLPDTVITWHGERIRFSDYDRRRAADARTPFAPLPLNAALFADYRKALRPGDTFTFRVLGRANRESLARTTVEIYGRYALLPNLMAEQPDAADVVLGFATALPRRGEFAHVQRLADGFWIARRHDAL